MMNLLKLKQSKTSQQFTQTLDLMTESVAIIADQTATGSHKSQIVFTNRAFVKFLLPHEVSFKRAE